MSDLVARSISGARTETMQLRRSPAVGLSKRVSGWRRGTTGVAPAPPIATKKRLSRTKAQRLVKYCSMRSMAHEGKSPLRRGGMCSGASRDARTRLMTSARVSVLSWSS